MIRIMKTTWHKFWYLTFNYRIHLNHHPLKNDKYIEKSTYHGNKLMKCLSKV
jgi:hypothetical protein